MQERIRNQLFLVLINSVFLVSPCLAAPEEEKVTPKAVIKVIRIGWIYSMANAPLIIADKKGYFLEQGIKVVLKSYTSGPPIKKDMKEGRLDIAYMGVPPVFKWFPKGVKTRIIAKVNYGQAAVIVNKNSSIKTIQGLRDKKFAGVKVYSGMDVLLRGFILGDKGGINPKTDIEIITMPPEKMGAAIENNKVAGAFLWEPFTSKYLLRGKVKIIFDMNKEYPRYPWYVIMAAPEAIKNKRIELTKVVKAHRKAVSFLNSSPSAGDNIIIEAFKLTAIKNGDKVLYSPAKILALAKQRLGWQARWTHRDTQFMQEVMNHSYKLGYINRIVNVSDIIDISFLFDTVIN